MKLSYRYEQTGCRLRVEGLPDLSAGQGPDRIGILSGWELALVGRPALEGKREHLEALLVVVLPYARHLISGVPRRFGQEGDPVVIEPSNGPTPAHRIRLRSSQSDTPPLELLVDDAELADLVRCLDLLRLDPRVEAGFTLPPDRPLPRREIRERIPLRQRLAAPLAGAAALAMTASVSLMVPLPKPTGAPAEAPLAAPAESEGVSPQR